MFCLNTILFLCYNYNVMNMRELEDYLKYLEYQKNYSKHTIDSYQKDIEEYLEYIEDKKLKLLKIN